MKSRAALVRAVRVPHLLTYRCKGCRSDKWFHGFRQAQYVRLVIVVANVYIKGRWRRTEYFHESCYRGQYGEAIPTKPIRRKVA